jgi:membrane protease subunit HflK
VATAEGDAARFKQILVEYSKAPQVTRDRMYIDTMRDMYNNVTKILVDTNKSNSLLYLPLDKIVAQVSAESAQAASAQVNQATSSSSTTSTPNGSVTVGGASGNNASSASSTSVPATGSSNADKRDGLRSRDRERDSR